MEPVTHVNLTSDFIVSWSSIFYIVVPTLVNLYHHASIQIRKERQKQKKVSQQAVGVNCFGNPKLRLDVITSSRVAVIPVIFAGIFALIAWTPHSVRNDPIACDVIWRCHLLMIMTHKAFIYIFVSLRVQIDAKKFEKFRKWGYICLGLASFWYLLEIILIVMSKSTTFVRNDFCQVDTVNIQDIIVGMGLGDIIISFFSLFAFVIPLRRLLMSMERSTSMQKTEELIRRVSFWSGLAIASNVIGVITLILIRDFGYICQPLDQCINIIAVTMQFQVIPIRDVVNFYMCGKIGGSEINENLSKTISASPQTGDSEMTSTAMSSTTR